MARLSESLLQSFRKVALVLSAAASCHVLTSSGVQLPALFKKKVFKLALTRLTVNVSALVDSLTLFSQVFAKFSHNYPPSLQGSVLESGLLSIHLPLRGWMVDGGWQEGMERNEGEETVVIFMFLGLPDFKYTKRWLM